MASYESPVHPNYKLGIIKAGLYDTVITNRGVGPCLRVLRTPLADAIIAGQTDFVNSMEGSKTAYFGGDLDAGLVPAGESSAVIDSVEPVADIISTIVNEFEAAVANMPRLA